MSLSVLRVSTRGLSAQATKAGKFPTKEDVDYASRFGFRPPAWKHEQNPHLKKHTPKTKFWVGLVKYFLGPLTVIFGARAIYLEIDEERHIFERRAPYIPMESMNIRRTRFPWGDGNHTLFHNPKRNTVPGIGYEVNPPEDAGHKEH